jgi:diguanylate cyclase (GGDEF)-like protein
MHHTPAADRHRFERLLTDVASRLMTISTASAPTELEHILDGLLDHLGAETAFIRRHNLRTRRTALIAHRWAMDASPLSEAYPVELHGQSAGQRTVGAETDLSFDDDPLLAVTEGQTAPLVTFSRPSGDYGDEERTLTTIPIRATGSTIGVVGFTHRGTRSWHDDELRTVTSIATLIAQLWRRLDGEQRLTYQLHYDELTGLPNSRELATRIDELQDDSEVSLLILDIDNMKVINDGLDFETGNQFISGLAKRLASIVRPSGMIARLSGDRFAILITETPPGHVERIAHRLVKELAETIRINEISIARSVSVGVAHNYIAQSNRQLLGEAEAALHQAKRNGKKQVAIFDADMRTRVLDRYEVEIELRQAIERGELTLYYQPEVDLETGEICAVEALLRWQHPRRGLLTAGAFIETAEESGLVVEIGDTVLRQAINQLSQWKEEHPQLEMWINVSPAQLMSRDLATQIQQLVDEFDVAADRICLEVTEHVVLGDIDATTGVLRRLRRMGVKLALDDFGTGYSSMKQLKQLPIDTLKIDRTFVSGLGVSDHDSAIVDAAITLASAFGLGTVAEGVETQQQITELRKRGCNHAQGFLLARPGPPDLIGPMLADPMEIERLTQL